MPLSFLTLIFTGGAIVGSFLNMLIDRLPKDEDIVFNPSHCDKCHHNLSVPDLIPVFSFLILKGRCRYCHKKITSRNLLVEIITGISFVFISVFYGIWGNYIQVFYQFIVVSLLITIFFIDYKKSIIPDSLVFLLIVTAILYKLFFSPSGIWSDLAAGAGFCLFFLLLVVMTKGKGMGLGDVKLALFMGFYLGMPKIIAAFYTAFLTGSVISLILVFRGHKSFKSRIPFGPFLVAATIIANFYGNELIYMFQNYFLK